jgi:hypothetical protein
MSRSGAHGRRAVDSGMPVAVLKSTDEAGANPDTEILTGLRPGMATVPGTVLVAISFPYARSS